MTVLTLITNCVKVTTRASGEWWSSVYKDCSTINSFFRYTLHRKVWIDSHVVGQAFTDMASVGKQAAAYLAVDDLIQVRNSLCSTIITFLHLSCVYVVQIEQRGLRIEYSSNSAEMGL